MKITPLVYTAASRIPALTDLFSDEIAIASMTVAEGGLITLNCSTPHGLAIGAQHGLFVADAWTPNPITALVEIATTAGLVREHDIRITVTYPHNLTTSPDAAHYFPWNAFANLTGIGIAALQGNIQLVAVESDLTFVVRPRDGVDVTLPGSVPGGAALLERLEREIIGWAAATATTADVLTMPTPTSVGRSFTVANPKVLRNIRVWGCVDFSQVLSHFTRSPESDAPELDRAYMFVLPQDRTRLSRDRSAQSDALTEMTPATFVRQTLMDGFEIVVGMPAERYGGAVACMDRCQGSVLSAVMRTFNGLKIRRTELVNGGGTDFLAVLSDHGAARYDVANYFHSYRFEAPAQITNADCVRPDETPDVSAIDEAIQNGDPIPTTPITPIGSVPFGGFQFGPDPAYGIWANDKPQPLTAIVNNLQGD